jgi:hypothetical protein
VNSYTIRFHTEAGIHLEQELNFNMPSGQKVIARGAVSKDKQGVPIKFGVFLDASCEAEGIDSAINSTQELVDSLVSLLSLSHQTWASPVRFVSGVDTTTGLRDREFIQHFSLPVNMMPSRKYRNEALSPIWDGLMSLKDESMPRLMRTIRWCRKAMLETDVLDQFMNLWTGLEVLNGLVKDKYGLPKDKPIRVCPKCKAPVVTEPTLAGIEHLFLHMLKSSSKTWSSVRDTRVGLIHGHKDLSRITKKAQELIPDMQRALLLGIFDILDIPEEIQKGLMREPLMESEPPTVKVRALLHQLPYEELANRGADPHLVITSMNGTTNVQQGGRRSEVVNMGLRMEGYQGKWTPVVGELYGKKLPSDLTFELSLTAQ